MNINASWHEPIKLTAVANGNAIFSIDEDLLEEDAGCYVFYNQIGNSRRLIYIGRANNLCVRIKAQMNNVKLMMAVKNIGRGQKMLMYCTIKRRGGQNIEKALAILENNLIKHAFTEGHKLINIKGARIHFHEINFTGNRTSESLFGREILSPTR